MQQLTLPMRDWSAARRRRALAVCLAVSLSIGILGGLALRHIFTQSDTLYYLNLAAGLPAILPFASRQLGPLLVRAFVHLTGSSIATGFVLEGLLALALFTSAVLFLLVRSAAPRFMLAAIAGLFFWGQQFNSLVMPDLLYAALLCGFLLLLRAQRFTLAALMMFPLVIARESTLLTLVCLLIAGWRLLRWRHVVTAVIALVAGIAVVKHLTANALPNTENISPALYLVAKMPWNLLKNFFGVDLWANVYTSCGVPRHSIDLHIGPLTRIGFCRWQWRYPLYLFHAALVSFGLLPLLLLKCRRSVLPLCRSSRPEDLMLRFCVVYGLISFVLAGTLGESFQRLFAYSWPLFLVALPRLLARSAATFASSRAALLFLTLHLLVSWLGFNIYLPWMGVACVLMYVAGWQILKHHWLPGSTPGPAESVPGFAPRNEPENVTI